MAYHYWIYRNNEYFGENFSKKKDAINFCRQRIPIHQSYRIEATWNGRYAGLVEQRC